MAVYPSIYKAKAVQATDTTLTAFIPQVFGDVPVIISEFLGPAAPGMGWVFFQAGNPEHPVWTTLTAGAGSVGPGAPNWSDEIIALQTIDTDLDGRIDKLEATADEVHVGPTAPTNPIQQIWYDTSQSGELKVKTNDLWQTVSTGGGADEVWVNTSAPTAGSTHELWYDPDAASVFPDEVVIGTTQPTDVAANLWVKTNEANALYAKVGGSWTKITGQTITFPEEVTVGTVQPTDPAAELWIKTDESNALYAKVSGSWVKVSAAATSVPNEVHVSATDPIDTYPEVELWVDSDEVSPLGEDARWNTAWGVIANVGCSDVAVTSDQPTQTTIRTLTTTALIPGRQYRAEVRQISSYVTGATAGGSFQVYLWLDGAGTGNNFAISVDFNGNYLSPGIVPFDFTVATTGSHTIDIKVSRNTPASGTLQARFYLHIIDIGPVGGALPAQQPAVGLEAAKPATPALPMRYFATDTQRDWLYDGTGWIIMAEPPQSYTPTTTNITSAGPTGTYHRSDGYCDFFSHINVGTLTGQPMIGLPQPAAVIMRYQLDCMLYQAGNNEFRGLASSAGAGAVAIAPLATWNTSSNGLEAALNLSATHPFTWASGCSIQIGGRYRMNSRYS